MSEMTAEAQAEAVRKEYGAYVALQPIDHDGVRAYNTGDPVPVSNVELHGYLEAGKVAKVGTKKAVEASPASTTKES